MAEVTDRVLVRFAGEGSGRGQLSWGQQTLWREFELIGTPIWLTGLRAAPPGWTVDDAADELAFIMSRNQSMRTKLDVRDDGSAHQVLCDHGEVYLQVIDVAPGDDPLVVARELQERWQEHELVYDFANDWPVRMALITHQGKAAYRVRATSHIVTDGFGALALQKDILARDPVTGAPAGPITAMEPLEQAQWQTSPAGKRCTQLCERYWERLLRAIPASRFGRIAGQEGSRYGRLTFDSRAAFLASQAIAARAGVGTSAVLLAAVAVGMARATGINPVVPRLYVSNRFRPRLATTVSPISQTCPCVIDVAGVPFDDVVRRAHSASLVAYKHAYFEPVRIRELVATAGQERGEPIDLAFVYNDIRFNTPRVADSSPPAAADVRAALPLTTLTWADRADLEGLCTLEFNDSVGTTNALLVLDTEYLSRAQAEAALRQMEAVLVAAAFDPQAATGL